MRAYRISTGTLLFAAAVCLSLGSNARAQVQVILNSPPASRMNLAALWHVTLINSGVPRQVLLYGVAYDGNGNFVADGLTSVFTIPKGVTVVSTPELEPIDYHSDPGYDGIVRRTGAVPSGTYTICVYAIDAKNTRDTLGRDCITNHVVLQVTPPQLIHPGNNDTVTETLPLFTWLPISPIVPVSDVTYAIRIVEVFGQQSAFDAMQSNPAWLVEDDVPSSIFQYPLSANTFERNTKYAWQVSAFAQSMNGERAELCKSEEWTFIIAGNAGDESFDTLPTTGRSKSIDSLAGNSMDSSKPTILTNIGIASLSLNLDTVKPLSGLCSSFKTSFKEIAGNDTALYALSVTNSYTGDTTSQRPHAFRIIVKGDSVISVAGVVTKDWKREPSKFPPASAIVQWTASDYVPSGESNLGNIKFSGAASPLIFYAWLDGNDSVICKDSVYLSQEISYYQLGDEPSDGFIEVPNDVLHIEYVNPYASTSGGGMSIIDRQTNVPVKSSSAKSPAVKNINGLNRMSVPLRDYHLVSGKVYTLTARDAQSTHFINFIVTSEKKQGRKE